MILKKLILSNGDKHSFPLLFLVLFISLFFANSALAIENCYNFGVYNVKVVDKKKAQNFEGDLKELEVKYDYDNNVFRVKITYNRVPNLKQTTGINVGFYNGFECTATDEYYKIKGFSKKVTRDFENNTSQIDDPDYVGIMKVVNSTKNSVTLDWIGPKAYKNERITNYCVATSVTQLGTFYQNGINCISSGPFTNCTGPGYVNGTVIKDQLTNWAKTKYDDLDILECGGPKSNFDGFGPAPSPSPLITYNSTLPSVVIENLSLNRVPDGVNLFFSRPSNIALDKEFGYVLGIQYQKMPNTNPSILNNYSETQILFNSYSYFSIKYSEIRDWLKSQGINSGDRAIMLSVKAHPKFANSNWSSGIYILPGEYK